ncbi:MAG: substrate-binding domain-containing protein [Cyanobacteria bacterium P01_F01_bin.116]
MVYSILSKPLWPRLSLLLLMGLVTSCGQPAASQSEENPNNPYAQFRQAVNEVEPLIDPSLESLTTSQFQQETPTVKSSITLAEDTPLAVQGDLTVVSAPTMQPFNERMYQRLIQAGYSGVLDINALRAGSAIQQFCQDRSIDFLTVNRAMTPAEIKTCQEKGLQPLGMSIGKDPLLLVVNKQNDFVQGVTLEKLKDILTSNTWSKVNPSWPNAPIERAMIGPNSSTVALLTQKLFPDNGAALLNASIAFYDYPEPMVQSLSPRSNSVAFINASIHERFTQTFKAIPINSISASPETVESNAYPLVQSLFLYVDQKQLTSGTPTKAVVNFYLTEMTNVMTEVGLLPLNPAQLDQTKNQWLKATGNN